MQELLLDLIEHAWIDRRASEVLDLLVERVGRALPRWEAAFVLAAEVAGSARIVAGSRGAASRDVRLDIERYPELAEAAPNRPPGDDSRRPERSPVRVGPARWSYEGTEVPVRAVAALPLTVAERLVGVLLLRTREPGARLTTTEEIFAMQVARAAARVVDADRRAPAASAGARPADPLTGLPNPAALDQRILEESERAKRYSLSFSLVLLDVDQQDELNGRLGRPSGDRLLASWGGCSSRGAGVGLRRATGVTSSPWCWRRPAPWCAGPGSPAAGEARGGFVRGTAAGGAAAGRGGHRAFPHPAVEERTTC